MSIVITLGTMRQNGKNRQNFSGGIFLWHGGGLVRLRRMLAGGQGF